MSATTGMNRITGATISGDDMLAQDIGDLLTTPLGSYIMRPDYGWLGIEILDRPLNRATVMLLVSAAVTALSRWITTTTVKKVTVTGDLASGKAVMTITHQRKGSGVASALTTQAIPLTR